MDTFIVSARKYRPQTFDTVVGQSHITTTLKNAIKNNQLAHAFLFCGPRGVGKTTCARILAKTINCENPTAEGEACNTCQFCVSFNEGASINYFELDAASNNSVDDIRELVNQVRYLPQSGRYKVYVIDEVHMLSSAAFNAFLKTLEEPPSYAIFILATTEKHKIIPTILSRCQIFDFKRISTNDTVQHLQQICEKEEIKAEKAALQIIAQKSEGCLRDALSILDKIVSFTGGEVTYAHTLEHLNVLDADYYFKLMDCMLAQDLSGAMLLYDDINRKGFEGDLVMDGFSECIRNLLVCKDEKAASLLETVDSFREKYIETAKKIHSPFLVSALNILNEAQINYKSARNKRLHTELTLIRLCYLLQAMEIVQDNAGLTKKKLTERPLAFRTAAIELWGIKKITKENKPSGKPEGDVKLVIETPVLQEPPSDYNSSGKKPGTSRPGKPAETGKSTGGAKIAVLEKIRNQYKSNGSKDNSNLPLQEGRLKDCWNQFAQQLKKARNPAAQSLELAALSITGENSFEIITTNNLQQKFIESERNKLFAFLQKELNNRLLKFNVRIQSGAEENIPVEKTLTSSEQFREMAEQYPQLKTLKDRLKMDLDY
jgi:DNA polymerase-3 subunit gamma/tau